MSFAQVIGFFKSKEPFFKQHFEEEDIVNNLSEAICNKIDFTESKNIVFLCIGSDRSTGDSLGPLVGSNLENLPFKNIYIFGTLDKPIHAENLIETQQYIEKTIKDPLIISIDAALGRLKNVGCLTFDVGSIKPGAAVDKELPLIGDFHIIGTVNVSGYQEFFVLQNTRLSLVVKMANAISAAIIKSLAKKRT